MDWFGDTRLGMKAHLPGLIMYFYGLNAHGKYRHTDRQKYPKSQSGKNDNVVMKIKAHNEARYRSETVFKFIYFLLFIS